VPIDNLKPSNWDICNADPEWNVTMLTVSKWAARAGFPFPGGRHVGDCPVRDGTLIARITLELYAQSSMAAKLEA